MCSCWTAHGAMKCPYKLAPAGSHVGKLCVARSLSTAQGPADPSTNMHRHRLSANRWPFFRGPIHSRRRFSASFQTPLHTPISNTHGYVYLRFVVAASTAVHQSSTTSTATQTTPNIRRMYIARAVCLRTSVFQCQRQLSPATVPVVLLCLEQR